MSEFEVWSVLTGFMISSAILQRQCFSWSGWLLGRQTRLPPKEAA